MSDDTLPPPLASPAPTLEGARSALVDGEWHRLHPLTPLLRGGLVLVIVLGIVISNLRDRLIDWLVLPVLPEGAEALESSDVVDLVLANNLLLIVLAAVAGVIAVVIAVFWVSWRFHTFRISHDAVEVRSGVVFRTHRRAPLDRVQAVNLQRPFVSRLVGLAKVEVVTGGTGANVPLEYLSSGVAETVRRDILTLASGARGAKTEQGAPRTAREGRFAHAAEAVSEGITGLMLGDQDPAAEPESIVRIPTGRLIAARLLDGTTVFTVVVLIAIVVGAITATPWVLFASIPLLLAGATITARGITRALRYSIAPTEHGTRLSFGLFTTVTEILPPGRVFAVRVTQPLLWRPFGWWVLSVNRMAGKSASASEAALSAAVLPVGTLADVERVLAILVPGDIGRDVPQLLGAGLAARPALDDGYATTPRRARLLNPIAWRRNGALVHPAALVLRRGRIWRSLAIFPLARMQSIALSQGPLARAFDLAHLTAHTVAGPVPGAISSLDRTEATRVWADAERCAIAAAAADHTHRWREGEGEGEGKSESTDAGDAVSGPVAASAPSVESAP